MKTDTRVILMLSRAVLLAVALTSPATAATFLCFGDSLTYGQSGTSTDSYLGSLGTYLTGLGDPALFINAGVSGENTTQGLERINTIIASSSASTVLLMEGTNDVNQWVVNPTFIDPNVTRANLSSMIDRIHAAGKTVIIATTPPRINDGTDRDNALTNQLNSIIRSVAASRGVTVAAVADNLQAIATRFVYSDTIHPDLLAFPIEAEAFAAAITGANISTIDLTGPLPVAVSPIPFSSGNSLSGDFEITVRELRSTADLTTARLTVDGAVVTPQVTQIGSDVRFFYDSPTGLRFGQRVEVSLTVSDTSVPPHTTTYAYFYRTSVGNGTAGDINRSGRIDGGDMAQLAIRFGARSFDARYDFAADIDANGAIDGLDLAIVAAAFGYRP